MARYAGNEESSVIDPTIILNERIKDHLINTSNTFHKADSLPGETHNRREKGSREGTRKAKPLAFEQHSVSLEYRYSSLADKIQFTDTFSHFHITSHGCVISRALKDTHCAYFHYINL